MNVLQNCAVELSENDKEEQNFRPALRVYLQKVLLIYFPGWLYNSGETSQP